MAHHQEWPQTLEASRKGHHAPHAFSSGLEEKVGAWAYLIHSGNSLFHKQMVNWKVADESLAGIFWLGANLQNSLLLDVIHFYPNSFMWWTNYGYFFMFAFSIRSRGCSRAAVPVPNPQNLPTLGQVPAWLWFDKKTQFSMLTAEQLEWDTGKKKSPHPHIRSQLYGMGFDWGVQWRIFWIEKNYSF